MARTFGRWSRFGIASLLTVVAVGVGAPPACPEGKTATEKGRADLRREIERRLDGQLDGLETLYRHLHANPELSFEEKQTAARMAKELKAIGFEVTTGVGGHGVVGVLRNGKGPTVLVRTDMDALPVTEKTGLPYASKVRTRDKDGKEVGVMHACGHDMHMTCWTGTARVLAGMKDRWQGTLVFIAQPAEEVGGGARRMLADGLFKRFPRPDYCLGLHCDGRHAHGHVSYAEGLLMANVDSVDILVRGKGGHGAAPHTTIDPIVLAARIVVDLQTIVSREVSPIDAAVVTVGSIHGGTKHNIIPSEVKLQLTVRSLKNEVRKHVLEAIQRLAKAAAAGARAPEPVIRFELDDFTPAVHNNGLLARKTAAMFRELLGADKVHEQGPIMGGEDFGRYGLEGVPIFFYFLGTIDPERVAAAAKPGGTPLPSLHSDLYHPVPRPTIRAGVLTMSAAVLNLVGK
ncbi:MAG: amidohydrolase [Gemmataceae bacterium]|nr:amidohydrolase [Gemmataceae bacterium]